MFQRLQTVAYFNKKSLIKTNVMPVVWQDLVTVGMLRSPELPPPPAWNDDDKNLETFQSCMVGRGLATNRFGVYSSKCT